MEETKKIRKTKWSFHLWNIGETKTMPRHELPLFRSALSVWNNKEGNQRIDYDYTNTVQTVTVTRIS